MEKIYRATKYIRTSCRDDETPYSDSIANQRRLIDAFIKSHPEIVTISERVDEGYSGLFAERPAFKELLADVEARVVNCIVVKDLSRWSRDYIETGRYLRDYFPTHGVRFISIDDHIDTLLPDGFNKTIALLKSIFSEHYSRDVSIKTRSVLDAKRRQGEYVGAMPIYGYQKAVEDKHKLIPDANTADVVKSIFHMKLCGLSAAAIAAELNRQNIVSPLSYRRERGLPCPTGGYADKANSHWGATTILRILRDENYTGTLVQGRQRGLSYKMKTPIALDECEWIKIRNAHEAIVSYADYEAVQRIMAIDTRTAPKQSKVHIFSGLLVCGCCNNNMTRKTVNDKERHYIYYYCPTTKRNGCHFLPMINENELVCVVTQKIKERIADIERLHSCLLESEMDALMQNEYDRQIAACDAKIRDLHKYKLHLASSRTEGFLTDTEYQELYNFYDRGITSLNVELSALWKESNSHGSSDENNLEWAQRFLQFSQTDKLDRLAVVMMVRSIRVFATKEVIVDFVCQSKYEQLLRYLMMGGYVNGAKEPQTELHS